VDAHLCVHRHDPRIAGADGDQRVPVGLARGHLAADGVARLAVPVGAVLDLGETAGLDGPGEEHRGPVARGVVGGGGQGTVDGGQVVAVGH